ncbi:ABC transporter permease subunit [Xylophilus rhododendri]|uniref:ABC transporter permease subunit n=1 Tax=Xylophilus rhododendri TaxID=2697032 RepID=A0A857J4R8_9BURK|nr:ABC transporter permease [Xylophilus rhododendri]QHI98960.1 ABC transporter permease subunit [Xylophilus rhododendri]
MLAYVVRRIASSLPTLLLAAVAVFTLIRMVPGDPAQLMLGDGADAAQIAQLRQQLGLDLPLWSQFLHWLQHVLAGDLGRSITSDQPVLPLILERFQVSASIVLSAVAMAAAIAVPAGLLAAWKQNGPLDFAIVAVSTLMLSIPSFWLGLLLLLWFGLHLGWLPVVGYVPMGQDLVQGLVYLVLPVATLVLIEVGVLTRMSRASAIEVLRLEYVSHARAKGVSEWGVLWRHVLPNAFSPTLTLIGLVLGHLLGGIAVLETVFTLPGLGRLLVDSILGRDYPVVQGCLLFTACIYVVINLVVDLCYPLFDPRVAAS